MMQVFWGPTGTNIYIIISAVKNWIEEKFRNTYICNE